MAAVVLALLAAASWGTGDFLGGLASRRAHVLAVLLISQFVGLVGITVWVAAAGEDAPSLAAMAPAFGAGVAGAVGLACLYRGMAVGAMGIVAPISAASPAVPLGVDLLRGHSPQPVQWLGIVIAVGGIVVLSHEPRGEGGRVAAGVGLALVAALGFGLFVVGLDATADESAVWATWGARLVAVLAAAAAALVVRVAPVVPRNLLLVVIGVGLFDTGANVLIAVATTKGLIGVVAVLSALYPVMTIALARVVLHERLDGWKRAGAALAIVGAALVAVG